MQQLTLVVILLLSIALTVAKYHIGCVFGDTAYSNGANIEDACMQVKCIDGTWNYTGIINHTCRECQVWGDPHFITFDPHHLKTDNYGGYYYIFNGDEDYVITQFGLDKDSADVGLIASFKPCYNYTKRYTCVRSIYYYEPGIDVNLTLPSPDLKQCYPSGDTPASPSNECAIKVLVKGKPKTLGKKVHSYHADEGEVLVFQHKHYGNADPAKYEDRNCINIVGYNGLSMSLCMADYLYYSNLYVWATQSLKQKPKSKLYGLCGTYTGDPQKEYTMPNGSKTTVTDLFGHSWSWSSQTAEFPIISPPNLDECTNTTLLSEIEDQCYNITKAVCENIPSWQCAAFTSSCEYDLCRMPNPVLYELYAQGYAFHMKIHGHLAQ